MQTIFIVKNAVRFQKNQQSCRIMSHLSDLVACVGHFRQIRQHATFRTSTSDLMGIFSVIWSQNSLYDQQSLYKQSGVLGTINFLRDVKICEMSDAMSDVMSHLVGPCRMQDRSELVRFSQKISMISKIGDIRLPDS